ncbi:MAG: circadian clock protein KaiC [Candidatus Riflebacteria bacterium]|nr:circadian clock protein KaiC [Candidatus Riflebacteria bacterium]
MENMENVCSLEPVQKVPTGIDGFDEITCGGLPRGRPALICGSAGCGKTLLGMQFLLNGAEKWNEPGVFFSFEESSEDLKSNFASLGYDLKKLLDQEKITIEHIPIERADYLETGEFDLEGFLARIEYIIDSVKAKRVVLDTIEMLFAGLPNPGIVRSELGRIFRRLKEKQVTAVVTAERGEVTLTRHGIEEYVADCVILLDNRINDQMATRRIRIMKYRGSFHATGEFPFLIDNTGISIIPVSSMGLKHSVSEERVPSGVAGLDEMLEGKGFFRGTTVLVSGTAGTGKTSLVASFVVASAARKEKSLWFGFEESPEQIIRNMRSIGLDLESCRKSGYIDFCMERSTKQGIESHLATIMRRVKQFEPKTVILDPITNFSSVGNFDDVKLLLTRVIDFLKTRGITAFFTSLTTGGRNLEALDVGVSSLVDSWILFRDVESGNERNRVIHILKSRGMGHSNQIRELLITSRGLSLVDVYLGQNGNLLTGSSRLVQESRDNAEKASRKRQLELKQQEFDRKREVVEARIASMRAEMEAEKQIALREVTFEREMQSFFEEEHAKLAARRGVSQK